MQQRLPLFRSKLPTLEKLEPYLKEIDGNRHHSNFGPLHQRFTQQLELHVGSGDGSIALTANGSLGLLHALGALGVQAGGLCAMPSWTYPATAAAACSAGLTPWFADVDPGTWALNPDTLRAALSDAPGPVSAVIAVAPFGSTLDVAAWDDFTDATGVPVVIDAANGFDALTVGRSPTMVSLHATKAFGVGEGGFVVSSDGDLIQRVSGLTNHGFTESGTAALRGVNAKLSEYAAAVGLAAFEDWPATREAYGALQRKYLDANAEIPGIDPAPDHAVDRVTSTFNVVLPGDAELAIAALGERKIEARKWWGEGCHRQPAYAEFPRTDLPVTEFLAARVVGLPFYLDMTEADVERVAGALVDYVAQTE